MVALAAIGCSEPPAREMHHAQGAIEAARAAGAEIYAPEEFREAEQALKESESSVTQRDYRLALRYALDARERAYEAARATANRKAEARGEAERALVAAENSVTLARERLATAQAARARAADLAPLRRALDQADDTLQKARAAMDEENYPEVTTIVEGTGERLDAAIQEMEKRIAPRPVRRRR